MSLKGRSGMDSVGERRKLAAGLRPALTAESLFERDDLQTWVN